MNSRTIFGFLLLFLLAGVPPYAAEVSLDAQRYMARGMAAMKLAKSPADFREAVKEFGEATRRAPDWADAWFNLGVAQESAEDYTGAMRSFKTYLEKNPRAADRNEVQTRIFELEYRQEKVTKQRGLALLQQVEQQQWINALQNGRWREKPPAKRVIDRLTVSNDGRLTMRVIFGPDVPQTVRGYRVLWPKPGMLSMIVEGSLSGLTLRGQFREWVGEDQQQNTGTFEGTVSAHGDRIELKTKYDAHPDMGAQNVTFLRQ